MQRLKMTTRMGSAEWRATDDKGQLIELPLAIELKDFTIDEYPPKLMLMKPAVRFPKNLLYMYCWKRE